MLVILFLYRGHLYPLSIFVLCLFLKIILKTNISSFLNWYMHALQRGQRRILDVLFYHSPLYFLETWCLTEPRAHHFGYTGWPESPSCPPFFAPHSSVVRGIHSHTHKCWGSEFDEAWLKKFLCSKTHKRPSHFVLIYADSCQGI